MSILNHPIIAIEDMANRLYEQGDKKMAIKLYKRVDFDVWCSKNLLRSLMPEKMVREYWENNVMDKSLYGED